MAHAEILPKTIGLVAELTHRCPLGCPYCCNPLALEPPADELDAAAWFRVFKEAAALGLRRVHLSGGEPGARPDLVDIAANAREAGLVTTLVTSGVGIRTRTLRDLWEAGLDRIQVSFQDADAVSADRIAGRRGAFQQKHALAVEAVRLGLPLTINVVMHRANIGRLADMVELALTLKANRIEIVPVRDSGWAELNRAALTPSDEQVQRAAAAAEALCHQHRGRVAIDTTPEGADWLHVTPSGRVLPSQAVDAIPSLEFWNVRDRSLADIWAQSPAFGAFRDGTAHRSIRAGIVTRMAVQDDAAYAYRRM